MQRIAHILPSRAKSMLLTMLCCAIAAQPCMGQFFDDSEFSREEQGSAMIDTMYVKGLRYLMNSQKADGSFPGQYGDQPAIAGFSLMCALAYGEDINVGTYAPMAKRSLDFILNNQDAKTGYIGNSMYNHGFATLALAEAYGMMRDSRIGPALQKAVKLILDAQKRNQMKAWRYGPQDADADSSVVGCIMVALYAARNAGIPVPDEALKDGLKYLADCRTEDGGYRYTTSNEETRVTMTCVGVLALSLDRSKDGPAYQRSLDYLVKRINYRDAAYPFYLEYYMSQALFHADENIWKEWNLKNIRYMKASQSPDGSWVYGNAPAYATSLALLSLAINYRFLPIYEK